MTAVLVVGPTFRPVIFGRRFSFGFAAAGLALRVWAWRIVITMAARAAFGGRPATLTTRPALRAVTRVGGAATGAALGVAMGAALGGRPAAVMMIRPPLAAVVARARD